MRRTRALVFVVAAVAWVRASVASSDGGDVSLAATTPSVAADGVVSVYRLLPKNSTQFDVIQRLYDNSTELQVSRASPVAPLPHVSADSAALPLTTAHLTFSFPPVARCLIAKTTIA